MSRGFALANLLFSPSSCFVLLLFALVVERLAFRCMVGSDVRSCILCDDLEGPDTDRSLPDATSKSFQPVRLFIALLSAYAARGPPDRKGS